MDFWNELFFSEDITITGKDEEVYLFESQIYYIYIHYQRLAILPSAKTFSVRLKLIIWKLLYPNHVLQLYLKKTHILSGLRYNEVKLVGSLVFYV